MSDYFKDELLQNQPIQMGLFTFYKLQEQPSTSMTFSFKHCESPASTIIPPKKRANGADRQWRKKNQQQRSEPLKRSLNCKGFLKNIGLNKDSVRNRQTFARKQSNFYKMNRFVSEEEIEIPPFSNSLQGRISEAQEQVLLDYSNKKFRMCNATNQQSIPAYIIRKKYFDSSKLNTDSPQEINRIDESLVIKIEKKELQNRRLTKDITIAKNQDRLASSFKGHSNKYTLTKTQSNREMAALRSINHQTEMKAKKYTHNLIHNISPKAQCNRTAFKMARKSIKLPSFRQRFKTEGFCIENRSSQKGNNEKSKQSFYLDHKYLKTQIQKIMIPQKGNII